MLSNGPNLLQNRWLSYMFLSAVYGAEPDVGLLAQLCGRLNGERFMHGAEGYDQFERLLRRIMDKPVEEMATSLAVEYAGLFLNAGLTPVFPFESAYTSPGQLLMQTARDKVLTEYRKERLVLSPQFKEFEDHIAVEMEFMSYLCRKAAEAVEAEDYGKVQRYLQKQKQFVGEHLLNWVPQFCMDVERAARTDFYRSVAGITAGYLSSEMQTIDKLQDSLKQG